VTEALVAGLLAGYGVAIPVGAIAALLVSLTAHTSLRVGASAALGVATADGLYAVAAVLGGTALARVVEPVSGPLRWVAAGVLVVIAASTARSTAAAVWTRAYRTPVSTTIPAGVQRVEVTSACWSPVQGTPHWRSRAGRPARAASSCGRSASTSENV
jgi:threonine/homoserine/homoserine lactone efflux protein